MRQGTLPTTLELLLLSILDTDGWWAAADVHEEYGRLPVDTVSYKTVFKTLQRMREAGWVLSRLEAKREGISGPRRVLFSLSRRGAAATSKVKDAINA